MHDTLLNASEHSLSAECFFFDELQELQSTAHSRVPLEIQKFEDFEWIFWGSGGCGAGEQAQAFTDKPPARAPEGELARRLPSRRGCPKRRVLKGRSRL